MSATNSFSQNVTKIILNPGKPEDSEYPEGSKVSH